MLHNWKSGLLALMAMVCGCQNMPPYAEDSGNDYAGYGMGGGQSWLTLPFKSGEYWVMTQGYGSNDDDYAGSHQDWDFTYGDDTYGLDFTQSGCDAYGKHVTPMLAGTVLQVGVEDGSGDQGYGNNVLIDHGDGYVSRYAHLSEVYVSEGDWLQDTDSLGEVGNTGYVYGEACQAHKGTHLHVAMYLNEEAVKPEPISGHYGLDTWCWYNREGDYDCEDDPGSYDAIEDDDDYYEEEQEEEENSDDGNDDNEEEDEDNNDDEEDNEIEDEGELDIAFVSISPEEGTADETAFVWVATVVSSDSEPEATLYITNPNDGVTYDFDMSTDSEESPYVFTYQKTLNDPNSTYNYWVSASNGDGNDSTRSQSIHVDRGSGDEPTLGMFSLSPSTGTHGDTEFEWKAWGDSESDAEVWLNIVNPSDATIYTFEMDVDMDGDEFVAEYEKTLNDPTVYTYWMTVQNDDTWNAGEVMSVETK